MDRMEIRPENRKQYVDMIAANVILSEYMENHAAELASWKEGKLPD
jgi:RNase H-fold protein (predicted Holliday junction resolvase)